MMNGRFAIKTKIMSNSHHDDHHSGSAKPVAFTMPLILASVLIFIIVLFLSLCDPKHHDAADNGHEGQAAAMESTRHKATTHEDHTATQAHTTVEKDTVSAETTVPAAEPAQAHH